MVRLFLQLRRLWRDSELSLREKIVKAGPIILKWLDGLGPKDKRWLRKRKRSK